MEAHEVALQEGLFEEHDISNQGQVDYQASRYRQL